MPQKMATFGALSNVPHKMALFGALLYVPQKFVTSYGATTIKE
jgi:hypothetical protein